ncbi:MAG TPA: hypothetical protein VGR53_02360 [Nitrososphaerales archaeon]|nr:hypothetical protein [Nitrososphaerales archaeon]
MALRTTASVARPKSRSLRVTIPEGVVAYLNIKDGDKLEWRMEILGTNKVILVQKAAENSENEPLFGEIPRKASTLDVLKRMEEGSRSSERGKS